MLFNSLIFPSFFVIVFCLYWFLLQRHLRLQNFFLLVASYIFYGWWDWRFLSLIFFSSIVDFVMGMKLNEEKSPKRRKLYLLISVCTNLGFLGFFKYFNFFIDSFADMLVFFGMQPNLPSLRFILPVGISFYTFQTMSYTLDIYFGKMKATRDPVAFFAFVAFFPQLVAGPIERAKRLLPQFSVARRFDPDRARDGLRQMLWGYFKKVVIADTMAPHVSTIFDNAGSLDGLTLAVGTFLFAIQIYCDFSGYSDIALGTARLLGFSLMRNFAYPYFSRDIAEFWRRWHISLSSWFRDYVYIPMGGSYVSRGKRIVNIIIIFTVSGFWHGANWTFIVWGLLNGLYYIPLMLRDRHKQHTDTVAEGRLLPSLPELGGLILTFAMALLAWIFFRAATLGDAFAYIARMATDPYLALDYSDYYRPLFWGCAVLVIEWLQRHRAHGMEIADKPLPFRWAAYVLLLVALLLFGNFGSQEFIYFQF